MITLKESQADRILELLQANGSATNRELNQVCLRYAARIHELRERGYHIVTERVDKGLFRFVYNGRPARTYTLL